MKKVFICSPYRSKDNKEKNIVTAQKACKAALKKGYLPYAPHLYFPQFLSDSDPQQRELGIMFGLSWLADCDELWVIGDIITEGMQREINSAEELGVPVISLLLKQ